ncbi:ACP S-malonyltransferase [Dictyobacter arantiisoli]|uniref:[acyl-carrier-protein] S-malonyltransferase n=1 Tax=Dictyobacter arantiisoli TaxID=2014874 RepID=A0A5A5T7Z4_9CHLR|nr:ACP S-malonyltransferase [Dictyobacter arantiisoli]GCF07143.1 polyketide biosynthesis protein PksE [Dictyobacter arantiisoli]
MKAFLFPGQGSQQKGMGGTLFDEFPEITRAADDILGYSIKNLCLHDPQQNLGKTQFTQPALYTANALIYLKNLQENGHPPAYAAGHSLGEYNALLAAGAFDFATGLKLVKKRGELMSQATGGGMAAVLGLNVTQVLKVLRENALSEIDIANHNSSTQIVIAGPKSVIERAKEIFEQNGAHLYIPLNVSGAFHSRALAPAQQQFARFLQDFTFSAVSFPVISNVHALPYPEREIRENLIQQITHQVRWLDTIQYLLNQSDIEMLEIGPGNVLTKLNAQIRRDNKNLEKIKGDPASELANRKSEEQRHQPVPNGYITAQQLGDAQFKKDYGLTYAYITGAMFRGIASEKLVVKVARAGMLGFYGAGGLRLTKIEEAICFIQKELRNQEAYGMNLLHNPTNPTLEEQTVNLYLKYKVSIVEASAFMSITPALIIYRARGLKRAFNGEITIGNRIVAKVSRPEVAEAFLSPAPERLVGKLLQERKITQEEATLLSRIPMADDLSVEADSGGHTDLGVAYALMPAIVQLRDEMMKKYQYAKRVRVGAAGGIGTPAAASAAFILGADFIVTGSINQCTVEAGTSDIAKDLLQQANVQDTDYAPAGDMFELGARIQVLKKSLFFPARANKLYELYRHHNSLDEIDEKTKNMLQTKFFYRSFDDIYEELKSTYPPTEIEKAERNPKYKMVLIFKWYFHYSSRLALSGNTEHKVDYQIHCGPALGSFNQWVKETGLENWRNRHVDEIGIKLIQETATLLNQRILSLQGVRQEVQL